VDCGLWTYMNQTYVLAQNSYWYGYRDLVRQLKEKTHLNKAKYQKEQGNGSVYYRQENYCARAMFF
jgi:hypothetical protein